MYLSPVLSVACPFLRDIHHRQIQHFQQAVICWEYRFGFGHFSQLAFESLYGIGRVNQPPDRFRIFEVGGQRCPVVMPGFIDLWVFRVPFVFEQF